MREHLDHEELEAVLTHELIHLSRRDYLMNWVAIMLRDAFFYLPTSRRAYGQLSHEKEMACDDLVVNVTRRPLVLASALAKVWLHLTDADGSQMPMAQMLLRKGEGMANRVERLLSVADPVSTSTPPLSRKKYLFISMLLLVVAVTLAVNVALAVALVVC
jgi:beta-lactamase regulating signal transducer with metallopeptidase domain